MIERPLISQAGYKLLTPEEKSRICNGAGAAGDWRSVLIPNTIYGLNCSAVFDIHDYDYYVGYTDEEKCTADTRMLTNLLRVINNEAGFFDVLRRYRAMTYYTAVAEGGDDAFFLEEKGNLHLHPTRETE